MAAILQATFSTAFCWRKMIEFRSTIHWNFILESAEKILASVVFTEGWKYKNLRWYMYLLNENITLPHGFNRIRHDDVIKWRHFPRCWPFVRGIHRSPVNSPHKCQRRGALMFSLICAWIDGWVNTGEAGDLRPYCAHYDVTVMVRMVSSTSRQHPFR